MLNTTPPVDSLKKQEKNMYSQYLVNKAKKEILLITTKSQET